MKRCQQAIDVGAAGGVAHQTDPLDFAGQGAQSGADLDIVILQEGKTDTGFVHAGRDGKLQAELCQTVSQLGVGGTRRWGPSR